MSRICRSPALLWGRQGRKKPFLSRRWYSFPPLPWAGRHQEPGKKKTPLQCHVALIHFKVLTYNVCALALDKASPTMEKCLEEEKQLRYNIIKRQFDWPVWVAPDWRHPHPRLPPRPSASQRGGPWLCSAVWLPPCRVGPWICRRVRFLEWGPQNLSSVWEESSERCRAFSHLENSGGMNLVCYSQFIRRRGAAKTIFRSKWIRPP